ncbi:MAG: IS1595 family transposase [Fimbriimonadales bacterium]
MKARLHRMSDDEAREMLEGIRWPNGPVCVHCGSVNVTRLNGKSTRPGLLKCRDCRKQFSVTVGTIFEASHIGLGDWMYAFASMCASKKGISAHQLHRELEVQYKTAWFMCHRIRFAMQHDGGMLKGDLEMDETYVGGVPRDPKKRGTGRGTTKTPVVGLVERDGQVRTRVVATVTAGILRETIDMHAHRDGTLYTDEFQGYIRLGREFAGGHKTTKHSIGEYGRPDGTNSNTIESFFATMKRGVYGTFHRISPDHLHRYCAEFEFRWNSRDADDYTRTVKALGQTEGKRLMYKGHLGNSAI